MNFKRLLTWKNLRKLGKWKFVALFSFGTGLLVISIMCLFRYLAYKLGITNNPTHDFSDLIYFYLAYCAVYVLVMSQVWDNNEKVFKKLENNK